MIALKQRGEDPNDYFEIGVGAGTTLVEGQTRLTEFTDLTITEKKQRKGKKGEKGTKASKSKTTAKPKRGRAKLVERIESLPDGERTFEAIVAKCPHPEHEVDFKKAAYLLHDVSSNKTTWLTPKTKEPSGTAVNSVYKWLRQNKNRKTKNTVKVLKDVGSNKHLYNEDNPWNPAEVDWMQSNYAKLRGWNQSNKIIAGFMFEDEVSTTQRKAWEVRDMATNLGLN